MISSDNNGGCLIFVAIFLGGSVIALMSWFSGGRHERDWWQDELTQRGVCEWYADPKTGVKELKWKCGEVPHEADRGD